MSPIAVEDGLDRLLDLLGLDLTDKQRTESLAILAQLPTTPAQASTPSTPSSSTDSSIPSSVIKLLSKGKMELPSTRLEHPQFLNYEHEGIPVYKLFMSSWDTLDITSLKLPKEWHFSSTGTVQFSEYAKRLTGVFTNSNPEVGWFATTAAAEFYPANFVVQGIPGTARSAFDQVNGALINFILSTTCTISQAHIFECKTGPSMLQKLNSIYGKDSARDLTNAYIQLMAIKMHSDENMDLFLHRVDQLRRQFPKGIPDDMIKSLLLKPGVLREEYLPTQTLMSDLGDPDQKTLAEVQRLLRRKGQELQSALSKSVEVLPKALVLDTPNRAKHTLDAPNREKRACPKCKGTEKHSWYYCKKGRKDTTKQEQIAALQAKIAALSEESPEIAVGQARKVTTTVTNKEDFMLLYSSLYPSSALRTPPELVRLPVVPRDIFPHLHLLPSGTVITSRTFMRRPNLNHPRTKMKIRDLKLSFRHHCQGLQLQPASSLVTISLPSLDTLTVVTTYLLQLIFSMIYVIGCFPTSISPPAEPTRSHAPARCFSVQSRTSRKGDNFGFTNISDSGCSEHLVCDISLLMDAVPCFSMGDSSPLVATHCGSVLLFTSGPTPRPVVLRNVFYGPEVSDNLISLGRLTDAGYTIQLTRTSLQVSDS